MILGFFCRDEDIVKVIILMLVKGGKGKCEFKIYKYNKKFLYYFGVRDL